MQVEITAPEDPADGLAAAVWTQIAEALGVTRQAVHKKHTRRLRSVRAIRP